MVTVQDTVMVGRAITVADIIDIISYLERKAWRNSGFSFAENRNAHKTKPRQPED